MSSSANVGLVAPSDIAQLAGVTRAAVSNWRKRRDDFPAAAAGTLAKPLFSRPEVEGWLKANGYRLQRDTGELTVWALINRFRDDVHADAARPLVQAILCARKLANGTPSMARLEVAARQPDFVRVLGSASNQPESDPRWNELVTDCLRLAAARSGHVMNLGSPADQLAGELFLTVGSIDVAELPAVSDHILSRFGAADGRMAGEYGLVNSRISRLLAQVGSTGEGVAYDPACGIGEALLRLWQESPVPNRIRLVGTDMNAEAVLYAKQRCFLYGAEATIVCADVLERDPIADLLADVVVAEPPFGMAMPPGFSLTDTRWALGGAPPRNNSETAWLQHALAHLAPSGRGLVITGLGSTFGNASAHIRRALVRARCVEAVVALPPKLLLHTAIPTALWILRSPGSRDVADRVTFLDLSTADPAGDLPIQSWLAQPEQQPEQLAWAQASIEDVLAEDGANLNPRRWIQTSVNINAVIDSYQRSVADLTATIDSLRNRPEMRMVQPVAPPKAVDMRTLEKQGAIRITQARGKGRRDDDMAEERVSPWVVTTRMIRDGLPKLPDASQSLDAAAGVSPADSSKSGHTITEPGDVLVTTMRTIRALVDEAGGRTLRPGVIRLRTDHHELDPHYLAECVAGSWNQRFEVGTSIPHANIRDLEIPLLPISEQIRVAEYLHHVRKLAASGHTLMSASEGLAAAQLDAIRFDITLPDATGPWAAEQ